MNGLDIDTFAAFEQLYDAQDGAIDVNSISSGDSNPPPIDASTENPEKVVFSSERTVSDRTRVFARKSDERNIHKDVEKMGFGDKIVSVANDIYNQVTKGEIKRGNSRKAIIFACIFQSFKINGVPQTHDKLINVFGLTRKSGLNGLKIVSLNAPKSSGIHDNHITPENIVKDVMEIFKASPAQIEEVINIYRFVKNTDVKLSTARPQSTACGLIYYWITTTGKNISLKDFAKTVELSEITISKMSAIVSRGASHFPKAPIIK